MYVWTWILVYATDERKKSSALNASSFFPVFTFFLFFVKIVQENNRGKLESFCAIKSGLIFNKSTFLGGAGNVALEKGRGLLKGER